MNMKNMKMIITAYGMLVCSLFSTIAYGQVKETFESAVTNGIAKGIIKRDGNKIIYLAAPATATDTAKIRGYYQALIKKSGKPYQFSFENRAVDTPLKAKDIANDKPIVQPKINNTDNSNINIEENGNENLAAIPVITEGTPGRQVAPAGCWTRQIVFGELHYIEQIERYTWSVPFGVTSIKIEAWSGGGNGNIKQYSGRELSTDYGGYSEVSGGGGGGGAYANAVIDVKQGDKLFIIIPAGGGGKSMVIRLNDNDNYFVLNNGADATTITQNGAIATDVKYAYEGGSGGNLGGAYGIFKQKMYWLAGENGETLQLNLQVGRQQSSLIGHFGDTKFVDGQTQGVYRAFGKGGSAAMLNNGGKEGKDINLTWGGQVRVLAKASNGGFPGGGGGGGNLELGSSYNDYHIYPSGHSGETHFGTTKGAPGMVIIHY
jgi:hypothetical protein